METKIIATNIVERLVEKGYIAYFAGGWVRDFLMGHPSEDIDIATNAPPEVIISLFPRTILVGLAFGIIVVVVDGHQFEVATFRRDIDYVDGRKPTSVVPTTPEEDASRRDFTINGMFYNPLTEEVHDYVGGLEDIKNHLIRAIGNPYERFVEDRLRMIRAVRFAARFNFTIDPDTHAAISASADTLFPAVAMERIWNEISKMAAYPRFDNAIIEMHRLGLLPTIFPALENTPLDEIKKRILAFPNYPKNTPPILYLLALFPGASNQETYDMCRYLKMSAADANVADFFVSLRYKIKNEDKNSFDKFVWAHLYSNPNIQCCLDIIAAGLTEKQGHEFISFHQQHQKNLHRHIERIIYQKPLVNAALLQKHGIVPGKLMGVLLKEAERIAITHDRNDANAVLEKLKLSAYWPKT